ncbi:putative Longin-like domain-containing protein [Seiridium cardinale]|uniref:Trafficking protein particle complex subunit n=1 Tax=Seiridium cardinale TaxID=138064 RepID=A0ABR2Y677_9PEZI
MSSPANGPSISHSHAGQPSKAVLAQHLPQPNEIANSVIQRMTAQGLHSTPAILAAAHRPRSCSSYETGGEWTAERLTRTEAFSIYWGPARFVPRCPTVSPPAISSSDHAPPSATTAAQQKATANNLLRKANDDAKLIFGTIFSLRNMARKLGGDDDAFISYRTGQYKLHYYETPSNLRFALLTEPGAPGMRNVLHQIYINLWVEYVVKNPLSPVEHKGGEGVRNEMFEMGLDKFVRGLM